MNFSKVASSAVLTAVSVLCFSGAAVAGPTMNCKTTFAGQTCETQEFVFEITHKSVTLIEKAVPGATGDMRELPILPGAVAEDPFGETVYADGNYRVEVGHTNGTQVYLRIGSQTWNFFHEVGTP